MTASRIRQLVAAAFVVFWSAGIGCGKRKGICRSVIDCPNGHYCETSDGLCAAFCKDDLECKPPRKCNKSSRQCEVPTCKPRSDSRCFEGHVYYYDSCDQRGEKAETCPAGCALDRCKRTTPLHCGDGRCDPASSEDCNSCPQDCKCQDGYQCSPSSGQCMPASAGCTKDSECPPGQACKASTCKLQTCGNGTCDPGEGCASCPKDCPCAGKTTCKEDRCQANPNGCKFESDCPPLHLCLKGQCVAICGNGTCEPQENCATCPKDCGCKQGQSCKNSACVDQATCGNGKCDGDEDCTRCPGDCPCSGGNACTQGKCHPKCPAGLADQWTCTGSQLERCGPSTNHTRETRTCPSGSCLNNSCCACKPGEVRCSGNEIQVCDPHCSSWVKKSSCSSVQVCQAGKCVCKESCTFDEHRCGTNTREVCSRSGGCTYWKPSQTKFQCGHKDGIYKDKKYCHQGKCCTRPGCK